MAEILSITNHKGGEARKERLVVLIWIVVTVNELGQEGLTIDMKVAELQRKIETHAKQMANSAPGRDGTSDGISHDVSEGVNIEVSPVGAMGITVMSSGRDGIKRGMR